MSHMLNTAAANPCAMLHWGRSPRGSLSLQAEKLSRRFNSDKSGISDKFGGTPDR